MQQQIYQEQQSQQGNGQQQMLLCPVRLVYETQILVQPGEQIQPNQTIFINPQNPPPWIQNRPQNQVIYVQQMPPNNFMPHVQQHGGQGPVYMQQNYNNLPQIMSQQAITQAQQEEARSANVQMANMQRGTVQVSQISNQSSPNVANSQAVGPPVSTYGMIPPYYTNMPNQLNQGQISFIPANVTNKQIVTNVQTGQKAQVQTNTMNMGRGMEMQQNVYRPVLQQTYQQDNNMAPNPLPQSITMVPMQTAQTHLKPSVNVTTLDPNVAQIRPLQTQITPVLSQNFISNDKILRKVAAIPPKGNTNIGGLINTQNKGTFTYTYRPIQPRPQQRHFAPNIIPANTHSQITLPPQPTSQPQTQISSATNTQNFPCATMPSPLPTTFIKTEQNVFNRKRKSESPDEIQKKMAPNIVAQKVITPPTVPIATTSTTFSDVGVNTVPMQRTGNKSLNTMAINQSISINRINDTKQQIKDNLTQRIESQAEKDSKQTSESEKLLRNTVYTQARNRLLADKQETLVTAAVKTETKVTDIKVEPIAEKETTKDSAPKIETKKVAVKVEEPKQPKIEKIKKEKESPPQNEKESPAQNEKETRREINLLGNGKINENGFVLTHVLDGYVIQESNVAFPIRKPLQERTLPPNVAGLEAKKEESKNTKCDQNGSKICSLSNLNLNEEKTAEDDKGEADAENVEESGENNKDNPFAELLTQTVKEWTAEQLTAHLQNFGWDETVLVLREHEIDGESLFLVSKNQLTTIGVNEDHAEIICQFVKS